MVRAGVSAKGGYGGQGKARQEEKDPLNLRCFSEHDRSCAIRDARPSASMKYFDRNRCWRMKKQRISTRCEKRDTS